MSAYKYFGCEIDEFLEMKMMLEQRVEKGRVALNALLQNCRSIGGVHGGTFKKLMESMDSLEQLQLRALRTYFGVGRNHHMVSL